MKFTRVSVLEQVQLLDTKICSKCKENLAITEFSKNSNTKSGLRSACRSCCKKSKDAWHAKNRESELRKYKEHYIQNRDSRITYQRRFRENNPDYAKSWLKSNPGKSSYYCSNRRSSILNATPIWADQDEINNIYIEAEYQQLEVDHIVPLVNKKVCGLHWEGNLQLLSRKENARKSNKLIEVEY